MIRSTLFAVALVAAAPSLAQAPAKAAGAVTSVPRAKVVANAEAEFTRVDANKDGQMSRAEIETFQRASLTAMAAERNKQVFAALDADKNGSLTAAEFAKLSGAPKVDAGSVLRIDSNKDGQVSLAEHRTATLATFTQLDANKDGALTAAEVQAVTKQ